jgi:hypothetical protein
VGQLVEQARASAGTTRAALVLRAKELLSQTDAIALPSGALPINDRALADRIEPTDASLQAAAELIATQSMLAARAVSPQIDAERADAALREVVRQSESSQEAATPLEVIALAIAAFLAGLTGPQPDLSVLLPAVGMAGVAVILFVVATLGRGLRERVRSEVALREAPSGERQDPTHHLRAADEALARARSRDAIHALYLYALTSLVAREAIRYDPALTDGELVIRAAGIPHADALRELIGVYEQAWFGLREPTADEARRARTLAVRVAG